MCTDAAVVFNQRSKTFSNEQIANTKSPRDAGVLGARQKESKDGVVIFNTSKLF